MNIDKLLSATLVRVLNDKNVVNELDLGDILGDYGGVKGSRKPQGATNPYFLVFPMPSNKNSDYQTYNGTIMIKFTLDNYSGGNAKTGLMGQVGERLDELFDDTPLAISGYTNYNLEVNQIHFPLFDPDFPDESYLSTRIKYNIIER